MAKRSWIVVLFLFAFFLGPVLEAQAQTTIRGFWKGFGKNKEEYDDDLQLYVGMTVPHISRSNFIINKKQNWNEIDINLFDQTTERFSSISSLPGYEIGIGIPVRYKVNTNLSLTTGFNFMFEAGSYRTINGDRQNPFPGSRLIYKYQNYSDPDYYSTRMMAGNEDKGHNFSTMEIPLDVKLYSAPKYFQPTSSNPYKLYLVAGIKQVWNWNAKKYYKNTTNTDIHDPPVIVKSNYRVWEAGLGIDLYFTYFKMSPEIRFSQSLSNLIDENHPKATDINWPNPYMAAIDKLSLRKVQFRLILE